MIRFSSHPLFGPYIRLMRLHQPTGIWLLLWPAWWSIMLASSPKDPWKTIMMLTIFAIGAVAMRSAGCILNDIMDRKLDAQVARTKQRPLASGELSLIQGIYCLASVIVLATSLLLFLPPITQLLALISLIPVTLYPLMKRFTYLPQLFLGFTINWGALMGWSAMTGALQFPAIMVYIAGILWTLAYDTIYAHQDKEDDALIGIKSTALLFGDRTHTWLERFYTGVIVFLAIGGANTTPAHWFYLLLLIAGGHLYWQYSRVKLDDPDSCMAIFRSNVWFGWLVFIATIAGAYL